MRLLIEFEKTERVRHLGLLDMQRTMQRALRRSHLPVSYSKGFNPHMNMSFASALSSGIPGDSEILDVAMAEPVTEAEALSALQAALPAALPVIRVRLVDDRFKKMGALLEAASYRFTIHDAEAGAALKAAIPAFLAQREIMALRKSKSAERMVDIRPMIFELAGETDNGLPVLQATVSFTEPATLNPTLLLEALSGFAGIPVPSVFIRRTGLFGRCNGQLCPLFDMP